MGFSSVCWVFIYISSVIAKDTVRLKEVSRGLTDVDPLLEAVQLEQWDGEEVPCFEAMLAMLHGVQNSTLWATWIWDSMQRPAGFLYGSRYQLGNFDQCVKPLWSNSHPHLRTQYCLADIHLTDTTPRKQLNSPDPYSPTRDYFDVTSKYGRHMNILTWGVCLPSVCSQRSVRKLVQAMVRTQHLQPLTPNPHITVDSCQRAVDRVEYSTEFYAFLLLLAAVTVTSILATLRPASDIKSSLPNRLLNSFDLKKSWSSLVKEQNGELKTLNGIKFLSTGTTIVAHYIFYVNSTANINGLDIERDLETELGISMVRVDVILDTFLFISGLLLMKGLMSGIRRNPLVGLVKRYIRVLLPLAVMVFYFAAVHKYIGSGPLWPRFSSEQQNLCMRNWWRNLLMVTNCAGNADICHIVTWYIASDFQLTIAGSALFYVYQKNRRLGKWLFTISVLIAALIPALLTYRNEMPAIMIHDIQKVIDLNSNEVYLKVYIQSHCRAVVYLLGMLMGYYMSFYKPEDCRNVISKNWSILATAVAFYIMHKVLRNGGLFIHKEYDVMEATIYVAFHRIWWSAAIACLIVVCEYGCVPLVKDILWLRPWGVLSKLCYTHYLVHMAIIYRHAHSARTPMTHEFFEMISNGVGVVFAIIPLSLYVYLFVETPAGNLANCLFASKNASAKAKENNATATKVNGVSEDKKLLNGTKLKNI